MKNQNSNSSEVISELVLLDDLRFHIFTMAPLKCLLNSARYVCKPWAATIRSSHFAEVYERRGCSKPGLYVENYGAHDKSYFLEFKDSVSGHFERTDLGTPQAMGHLVGTCDGILLLISNYSKQIYIVNPILKCWLRIPFFPNLQEPWVFDHRFAIARVPRTRKFKLFFVNYLKISDTFWHVYYVLRIGVDNSWKEIARKEALRLRKTLYNGGNDLYCITMDEVIVIDVEKETIVRDYPLSPMPVHNIEQILWMENYLSCIVNIDEDLSIYQIYILDFDSGKWSLYHTMGPFDIHELEIKSVEFLLWINDQIILRVVDAAFKFINIKIYFGYNVKTRQLTKIEDIGMGPFEVWSHTNSLVLW